MLELRANGLGKRICQSFDGATGLLQPWKKRRPRDKHGFDTHAYPRCAISLEQSIGALVSPLGYSNVQP